MAVYPWRFQADLKAGEPDPDVTVFVGDQYTNDVTGEKRVYQDTNNPIIVKLSALPQFVATGLADGVTREPPPDPEAA